jgi:hypothetical protein
VKRLLALSLALAALAAGAAPQRAPAAKAEVPCGLPQGRPLWVDYADGSVPFWSTVFARPGIVGAAANFIVPPQLRAGGAKTVYFDLNFHNRMGSPSAPVDPASIRDRAEKLFETASKSSACDKPLIALNELFGAQTPTPWTPSTTTYRANVLAFVQRLSELGARPFLLLSQRPYTHDEAGDWWRQAAQYADLVPEVFFNGPSVSKQGPVKGSTRMRSTIRTRIHDLTDLGIPASRIGVTLTFSSTPKTGGREGLKPLSKWLDVVKWEALAVKAVAKETRISSVWSWGWAAWNVAGNDPEKPVAACVWLWTRDHSLCDAPKVAGKQLDPSLQVGRSIPGGALCLLDDRPLWRSAVTALTRITRDPDIALSASLQRLVLSEAATATSGDVLAAERDVIADRFGGSRAAYLAALRHAGATLTAARAVLGDELRSRNVERGLSVRAPSARDIADLYARYDGADARLIRSTKRLPWLGNRGTGVAIAATAPRRVFALAPNGRATIGDAHVTALGATTPLGAFSLAAAAPTLRAALVEVARVDAYRTWSSRHQNQALARIECAGDTFPQPTPVDVTAWLPFLALP